MPAPTERYLPIDEEGYFVFDGKRVEDEKLGRTLLENLAPADTFRFTTEMEGQRAWVEPFDEPLIARHLHKPEAQKLADVFCTFDGPYRSSMRFALGTLSVDEWDRFHGVTDKQIPFVLSRAAQVEFFDMLEEFDDESVTIAGKRYPTPPWLAPTTEVTTSPFWSTRYKSSETPWELGRESVVLPAVLPQLKLNKGRVLVLGCGSGHDAAYFARQGHMVTAVDFSEEAVRQVRANYAELENLKIVQADAFNLPKEFINRFDLIFEHTCYCAISPDKRDALVKVWSKALVPHGDLLGVFFVNEKREGPPFGGSEWELRARLQDKFDFLFWTRWRGSVEDRKGKELVIYARKKS